MELEITSDSPQLRDRGPSTALQWTTNFSGTLFVWTKSEGLDLFARLEDDSGKVLVEDDDSGGRATPCMQLDVEPERSLIIRVAAQVGRIGRFELHVVAAPETISSRKTAAEARIELDSLKELQKDKANLARRKTERLIERLCKEIRSRSSYLASCVLFDCGTLAKELDDARSASRAFGAVAELWSRVRPASDERLQWARWGVATALCKLGDLYGALSFGEMVLASGSLPDEHASLQYRRRWVAWIMQRLGDLHGSRVLSEKALQVYSKTRPDDDPDLQDTRSSMGNILAGLGDIRGARVYFEKVLDIRSNTLSGDDLKLQQTKVDLSICLAHLGDLPGSLALKQSALAVYSRSLPENSWEILRVQLGIAYLLRCLGELEQARVLGESVLEARMKALAESDPDLQHARCVLVWTYTLLGMEKKALMLASHLAQGLMDALPALSIEEAPAQLEIRAMSAIGLSDVLSLASGAGFFDPSPILDRSGFLLVESLRGIGLLSARLAGMADPGASGAREEASALSKDLARLVRSGSSPEEINAIRHKRDAAWRKLINGVFSRRGGDLFIQPTTEAFTRVLAAREAIVSFRRYTRTSKEPADPKQVTKVESLLAFVLGAEGKLTRVELGPIEPIVASVEQWRRALGTAPSSRGIGSGQAATEADELQAGEALRKLVWDPLRVALGISQHVILALDDVLHLVPFDALPDGEGVVGDRITFEIRTSLQELLWKNRPSEAPPHAFVGLGGAAFGRTATVLADSTNVPETRSDPKGAHASLLRGGVNEEGFQELPGTAREVEALREIHTEAFGKKKGVFILRGAEASRDALEALAPSARYVHIATHGWCAQVSAGPIAEGTILDAKLNFGQAMSTDELTVGSSPMTLCGLALAGANLPADTIGRVHGLVTAEEIASWDLSNCELVVLSACDTNVGVRRAGQGVASLQKALHMAGARSAITSLWKVPDELTAELMMDFYRRLWIDHEPIGQALWKAKTELRSRGIPTRDWAAWELTGQSK